MSYILCLGLQSFQYNKEPLVRLYLDDTFLYEFNIKTKKTSKDFKIYIAKKNQNKFFYENFRETLFFSNEYKEYLKNTHSLKNVNNFNKVLRYQGNVLADDVNFFFFKLDATRVSNAQNLIIEILSFDSNYTNGFMTESTIYSLRAGYLIPEQIIENYSKFFQSYHEKQQKHKNSCKSLTEIVNWYKKNYNQKDESYLNIISDRLVNILNHTNDKVQFEGYFSLNWFGGYKKIVCKLDKNKHQIDDYCIKNDLLQSDLMYAICNKYKQYENQ